MSTEIINGLFSIGAAFVAFTGGILSTTINTKRKERAEEIKKLKTDVKQLANEVICYSQLEDALVNELKTWTNDPKKEIRIRYYEQLFEDGRKSLMTANKAQGILEKYSL